MNVLLQIVVHTPEGEKEPFGRQTLFVQKGQITLPPMLLQQQWFTVANHESLKVSVRDAELEGDKSSSSKAASTSTPARATNKVVYGCFYVRRIRRPMKLKVLPAGGLFEDYPVTLVAAGGVKKSLLLKVGVCGWKT
jgi:hypothetical protein